MNILVIGLGSMGKRRIRNLQAIGGHVLAGLDVRPDRREEITKNFGLQTFCDLDEMSQQFSPDAIVISTPPKLHMTYANWAVEQGCHCFIEASVTDREAIESLAKRVQSTDLIIAPSCTMTFYPGPQRIAQILQDRLIGDVLSINYVTGQYLPDWHPWESIQEYYVSDRETGGAREIVPFELTWLNQLFGTPEALSSVVMKKTDMPAEIDDIYHCLLQYPKHKILLNLTVEVISRPIATREMVILGSEGKLQFSSHRNEVAYCNTNEPQWVRFPLDKGIVEQHYINPEEPYIQEVKAFLGAIASQGKTPFPNSLEEDARVLSVLETLEDKNLMRA
ncbi:Gfo/Idh/MocA family protein [Algicola sagamiensis]|uniref:Gfo/Idh/MocA family protein n=1 Tax=Algicola sagamiensis TaxID=163869 RepID=UPI00036609C2|nr:Gfo/Idh/MocA family oxidoreductase [Algicola sagamiensis]